MKGLFKFPWAWLLALLICLGQQGAVLHSLSHGLETMTGVHASAAKSMTLLTDNGPADADDSPCLICVALNSFSAMALAAVFLFPVRCSRGALAPRDKPLSPQGSPPLTRARSPPRLSITF